MSKDNRNLMNRRNFVASAAAAAAVAAVPTRGAAQDMPRLEESDPTAVALKYVHDATTVDAALRPDERYCNNCALYNGAADAEWAPCSIFPGKLVAGKGWCSVWAPKQNG